VEIRAVASRKEIEALASVNIFWEQVGKIMLNT